MPQLFEYIDRHRTKTFLLKRAGLAETDSMLRDRMLSDGSLQLAGLQVGVQPSLRSVFSLFTRAKHALERRTPGRQLDTLSEEEVWCSAQRPPAASSPPSCTSSTYHAEKVVGAVTVKRHVRMCPSAHVRTHAPSVCRCWPR